MYYNPPERAKRPGKDHVSTLTFTGRFLISLSCRTGFCFVHIQDHAILPTRLRYTCFPLPPSAVFASEG